MTTFNVPTSAQVGDALKTTAYLAVRIIAYAVVLAQFTWEAGYKAGETIHRLNDWMASAIHRPEQALADLAQQAVTWANRVLAEPQPEAVPILTGAELVALWGAEILPDEDQEVKPRRKAAPRTTARRKPATARKAKAAG